MARSILIFGFILALLAPSAAQTGFKITEGRRHVEIPFQYINNFIILTLNFNGYLPLKFIFDTGAEHTILTKREISDLMRIQYEREFRVTGSDLKTPLVAYLARHIRFDIADKVTAPSEDILVLEDDYFRFEEYAGVDVHGILSAMMFSNYIIKINYDKHTISLYDRSVFRMRESGFEPISVELYRNKVYLNTTLQVLPDSIADVKLLIDTGAGLPLLLFSNTHPLVYPPARALPSNIGMGLGGYLEGFTGRIHRVGLGDFAQQGVVTYFQELDSTLNMEYLNYRDGLIGNTLLSHFQVIIDYRDALIYLKPSRTYREKYVYDRSGISLIATGSRFNEYIVQNVLPNSPGAEADIRRDDEIVSVRGFPVTFFSLSDIQRILQKKPGKRIRIVIKRDGERIKKHIVLRELI
ncbi:MAG: PDZ domain-containing protein [Bacteroidetes bacterium]|nr:MAG: PDZ domain-containing protein [Bacteroidota bacterium]